MNTQSELNSEGWIPATPDNIPDDNVVVEIKSVTGLGNTYIDRGYYFKGRWYNEDHKRNRSFYGRAITHYRFL